MPGVALWIYLLALLLLCLLWGGWGLYWLRSPRPDFSSQALTGPEAARVEAFRRSRYAIHALFVLGLFASVWAVSHFQLGEWGLYSSILSLVLAYCLLLAIPRCPRCGNRIYVASNGWHWEICMRCRVRFRAASPGRAAGPTAEEDGRRDVSSS